MPTLEQTKIDAAEERKELMTAISSSTFSIEGKALKGAAAQNYLVTEVGFTQREALNFLVSKFKRRKHVTPITR